MLINNKKTYQLSKLVFILFLTISWLSKAQNLVPNGSFEILADCPLGADIEKAIGWFSPNNGTPDLFNVCANISSNCSVPINGFGYQHAQDGNGYAGIVTYSYSGSSNNYREYLEIELTSTLKNKTLYHISFFKNQSNNSPVAANNLSYGFSKDVIYQSVQSIISPTYVYEDKTLLNDTLNWIKVEGYYLATGGENYLLIGNFLNDSQTDTISTGMPQTDAYYLIDNISVTEFPIGNENIFTPNNDGVNDVIFKNQSFVGFEVEILNRWGEIINQVNYGVGWDGKSRRGDDAVEGIYFFNIRSINNSKDIIKTGFFQLMR